MNDADRERDVLQRVLWPGPVSVSLPDNFTPLHPGAAVEAVLPGVRDGIYVLVMPGASDAHCTHLLAPFGVSRLVLPGTSVYVVRGPCTANMVVVNILAGVNALRAAGAAHVGLLLASDTAMCAAQLLAAYFSNAFVLTQGALAEDRLPEFLRDKFFCCLRGRSFDTARWRWQTRVARHCGRQCRTLRVDNSICAHLELPTYSAVLDPLVFAFEPVMPVNFVSIASAGDSFAYMSRATDSSSDWVVYFHGNGESVTNYCFEKGPGFLHHFHQRGWNVLLAEYRGYHPRMARTGSQTVHNVSGDATAFVHFASTRLHARRVVVYGRR